MKNKNCIVVGSGLTGLFSSILLADIFENVYVIEKENICGGLLSSIKDDSGIIYDQGTHIPDLTQNKEIDKILFGDFKEREKNWNMLGISRSGNYFNGQMNEKNPMIDTRSLPSDIYQKGILELLTLTEKSSSTKLDEFMNETIGSTFTKNICAPVVRKFYDVELSELTSENFIKYVGLSRFIGLNPSATMLLKNISVYDEKLAFHSVDDYLDSLENSNEEYGINLYPKKDGVNYWINYLESKARKKGVNIIFGETVKLLNHSGNKINSIELGVSGKKIDCDFIVWSAPPNLALSAAGIESKKAIVNFRSTSIFHFSFDRLEVNDKLHYLWNWDKEYQHYRITLYPNLRPNIAPSENNISVEVMSSLEELESINSDDIYKELISIGIIDDSTKVLSKKRQNIKVTFPIPTFDFDSAIKENHQLLSSSFENIMLSGRYGGKSWFHRDVVKGAYLDIQKRFGIN